MHRNCICGHDAADHVKGKDGCAFCTCHQFLAGVTPGPVTGDAALRSVSLADVDRILCDDRTFRLPDAFGKPRYRLRSGEVLRLLAWPKNGMPGRVQVENPTIEQVRDRARLIATRGYRRPAEHCCS